MTNHFISFALLCFSCSGISPSNILVVSPVASISHFKIGEAISVGLSKAGHTVTIVSAYDYKPKNASKIESIQVSGAIERAEEMKKEFDAKGLDGFVKMPVAVTVSGLLYNGANLCNTTLTDPKVRALFNRKFDLVIVEVFGTESLIGLGQIYDAPVIGFSPFSTCRWIDDLIGNPSPLSYVSHPISEFPDRMNYLHRMHNTLFYVYESILLLFLHHPLQRSVYNNAFPNAKLSYDEARKNVALTFVNSHFSLARPLPYATNVIEVGGIHVNRNTSPLPQDIKQFIDTATDGIVYFSFGSILKSEKLPEDKRNAFIDTFAKLKQKVIWKFEDPTVKMPENVLARSWFPQADILGHPNVKAFISHGGLLGSTEAVYSGVPILGIPFFGDQRLNIRRASQTGWALTLDYNNISTDSLEWAMNEILQDKYLENARTVSKRYRDQPMTPTDTMVYWSEYVIRHKEAPHIRSPGLDLNYFQDHNLDVLATIFCIVILTVYALKWVLQKMFSRKSEAMSKVKVERNNFNFSNKERNSNKKTLRLKTH